MNIRKAVDTLLIEQGLSRNQLAERMGKAHSNIGNICARDNINTKTIESICKALDVKPSRFVEIAES